MNRFHLIVAAALAAGRAKRKPAGSGSAPSFISAPSLSGVPLIGTPLGYTAGTVDGLPTPTVTRQWLRNGVAISGATGTTYTPVSGDAGQSLSIRETATNSNGSVNSTSNSLTVAQAPSFSAAPVILGTPTVGTPVAYTAGTSSGSPTPTRSQQWLLDGVAISGATNPTYTPVSGDVGSGRLSVRETATNLAGSANSTSSASNVAAAPSLTLTLSGSSSGTTGVATTFAVTPSGPMAANTTVNISAPGATLSTSSLSFLAGSSAAQTFTVTRATDGTTSVSITNTGSVPQVGSPISYTSVAAGAALTSMTLLTAGAGTYPWCAAHAFKPGDVPVEALEGLQCTVKSRWPDGSAKIAILAGTVTAAGTSTSVSLRPGQPLNTAWLTLAQLVATGITAAVTTDAYGSATWSNADFATPFMTWAEGPAMSSWIFRKVIGTDDHLVAWLEVRLFDVAGTKHVEVLPWVENGYLLKASPGGRDGTYTFTLGGTNRFGPTALTVNHHTRGVLVSGSALSHWLGSDMTVTPKHNSSYLASTGLVQAYEPSLAGNWPTLEGGATKGVSSVFSPFTPFTTSNTIHSTSMGQPGGHDSIGVQPAWEAIALLDNSKLGFEQMIRESYRFGNMQIHYRDENTNRPIRFSQHANTAIFYNYSPDRQNFPYIEGGGTVYPPNPATGLGGQDARFKPSHQPAAPLLAYITTGRFYFMEECQHIAGINFLLTALQRNGSDGLLNPNATAYVEIRHVAWAMRNYAIAACVTPDDDALKPDLDNCIQKNIEHYHSTYVAGPGNPYGLIERNGSGFGGDQAWQYDFWTAAWARAIAFRVGKTVALRQKARQFFDWVSKSIVGRLGPAGSSTDFPYRHATCALITNEPYLYPGSQALAYPGFASPAYPDYSTGAGPWWASWGAYYNAWIVAKHGWSGGNTDGALQDYSGSPLNDNNGWWAMVNVAATACASLGAPGAAAGLARITGASNWSSFLGGFTGQRPGNATVAVTLPLEDFNDYIPAAGNRANVNKNSAASVDYDRIVGLASGGAYRWWNGYGYQEANTAFASMHSSYSGTIKAPGYGNRGGFIVHGGGHGGQVGAIAYPFDFDTMTWRCVGAPRNLPPNFNWAGYASPPSPTRTEGLEQRDTDWMDYLWNGSYIKLSDHEYVQNFYVPPGTPGVGSLGALMLPQGTFSQDPGVADPRTGIAYQWRPHLMDLATGKMTRASAATRGGWFPGFVYTQRTTVVDTTRNRAWYFNHGNITANYENLSTGAPYTLNSHTVQKASGGNTDFIQGTNTVYTYVAEADALLSWTPARANEGMPADANGTPTVRVFSMSTGFPVDLQRSANIGTYPIQHGGFFMGVAWAPASVVGGVGKFYFYEGLGQNFCYTLTPSSLDFATCTWTWGRESFGGAAPVNGMGTPNLSDAQRQGVQNKWMWSPSHGCFVWHDGPLTSGVCADGVTRTGIVQLWRPPGTPI